MIHSKPKVITKLSDRLLFEVSQILVVLSVQVIGSHHPKLGEGAASSALLQVPGLLAQLAFWDGAPTHN